MMRGAGGEGRGTTIKGGTWPARPPSPQISHPGPRMRPPGLSLPTLFPEDSSMHAWPMATPVPTV